MHSRDNREKAAAPAERLGSDTWDQEANTAFAV
jgi:hypothetical protein